MFKIFVKIRFHAYFRQTGWQEFQFLFILQFFRFSIFIIILRMYEEYDENQCSESCITNFRSIQTNPGTRIHYAVIRTKVKVITVDVWLQDYTYLAPRSLQLTITTWEVVHTTFSLPHNNSPNPQLVSFSVWVQLPSVLSLLPPLRSLSFQNLLKIPSILILYFMPYH